MTVQDKQREGNDFGGSPALVYALNHPLRRTILRHMLSQPDEVDALSPNQVSVAIDRRLSNVSYHFRVLVDTQALTLVRRGRVRGAIEHFYRPSDAFRGSTWVKRALRETAATDPEHPRSGARREADDSDSK